MKNKVAIVTGAGRGIGKGIAEELAAKGARVVIADLEPEEGQATVRQISEAGGEALFIQTDVASEKSIRTMIEQVAQQCGKIDTLVNNAGITLFKPIFEATLDDWDRVMNVDLRGVFLCSKYAAEVMRKQGSGSIINISSNHAVATLPDTEIYAAAKAGVNGMTRSMALSLGPYGIRVNAICPGFTDTPHYRKWLQQKPSPHQTESEVLNLHATGRILSPQDVGKLAVYLASEDAAAMTGATLVLDNGLTPRLYKADDF